MITQKITWRGKIGILLSLLSFVVFLAQPLFAQDPYSTTTTTTEATQPTTTVSTTETTTTTTEPTSTTTTETTTDSLAVSDQPLSTSTETTTTETTTAAVAIGVSTDGLVTVGGLKPGTEVTFDSKYLTKDPNDKDRVSCTVTADANGTATCQLAEPAKDYANVGMTIRYNGTSTRINLEYKDRVWSIKPGK